MSISELLLYLRLALYPSLALMFVFYAFTGDKPGKLKNVNLPVFLGMALLMVGLWGSSITLWATRDNTAVLKYNSIALIPTLILLFVIMTISLLRSSKN